MRGQAWRRRRRLRGRETASLIAAVSSRSKPDCVPSRSTEVSKISSCSQFDAALGPIFRVQQSCFAAAAYPYLPVLVLALRVNRQHDGLRAELR